MRTLISLFLVLVGSFLVAAPLFFSFLLAVSGNGAGLVTRDDRDVCSVAGGFLLFVGIILSIISFATVGKTRPRE